MRQIHRLEGAPFVLLALNSGRMDELQILKAHGFVDIVECDGVWNGESEKSYAVFFNGPQQLQTLIHVAKDYNQDAILIVDSERQSKAMFLKTGEQTKVGRFGPVSKAEALLGGNYTYVPVMDTYFRAG